MDHIELVFTRDALEQIARYAFLANETTENIGARRLHTVMENLLDDISFNADGTFPMTRVEIDAKYVNDHLSGEIMEEDLHRYIL